MSAAAATGPRAGGSAQREKAEPGAWLAAGAGPDGGDPDDGAGLVPADARPADATAATLSRLALRTSMRNQLPATVEHLETTGRIVRVVMRLDGRAADHVAARITRESAELLGLRPGLPVIALCKATAVAQATARRYSCRRREMPSTVVLGTSASDA